MGSIYGVKPIPGSKADQVDALLFDGSLDLLFQQFHKNTVLSKYRMLLL
jgi:hypothetical protein